MKVLYAVAAKLGRGIGWTAQNAIEQARKNGVEVVSRTLDDWPDLTNSALKEIFFSDRLVTELERVKPDILHVWNGMGLTAIMKAKTLGIKVVVERASSSPVWQNYVLESEYKGLAVPDDVFVRCMDELVLADVVTVPSEVAAQTYSERINVKIIPFGVDSQKFRPEPVAHDEYRILFAGDNVLRKGINYLLEAWKTVNTPHWELWLKANVYEPRRYGNLRNILVFNEVESMSELFNRVDVFCLPSIEEGQALVVWEAMACGLPCVVTRECGSLIKHDVHGLIVPPKDSKAIFLALESLVTAPETRERMGKAARALAEEYPWERYGRELVGLYKSLA